MGLSSCVPRIVPRASRCLRFSLRLSMGSIHSGSDGRILRVYIPLRGGKIAVTREIGEGKRVHVNRPARKAGVSKVYSGNR